MVDADDLRGFGLDPAWSRIVEVPSHDDATYQWHVLDRAAALGAGGVTVVCLHGNPTWSFLWSRLMAELSPAHRIIAPDQLSMGYSQRIGPRSYSDRVRDIEDLLRALEVDGPVWLVAQDWGGAIAMGFAVAHPDRISGLVLSNTGIAVPAGRKAPWLIKLAATTGVHRLTTRTTPLFVRGTPFLPGRSLTRVQRRALAAPYRGAGRRDGVAGFVADVPFDDQHPSAAALAAVAEALPKLNVPVRLVWGARDPVFNDDFAEDLRARFHDVELHRIADTGHLTVLEASIAPYVEAAMAAQAAVVSPIAGASDVDVDVDGAPLWSLIGHGAPGAIAISDAAADATITDAAFAGRVASFAHELHGRGVQSGDRIAVLVPPGINLIAVVYACWRIGAVTVVADRGLGLRGLGAAVRSARVRHVVGPTAAIAAARTLRWAPRAHMISLSSLDGSALQRLDQLDVVEPDAAAPAAVVFTSGATGPAKGVR